MSENLESNGTASQCEDWQTHQSGFALTNVGCKIPERQMVVRQVLGDRNCAYSTAVILLPTGKTNIHKPEAGAVLSWEQTRENSWQVK